MGEEDGKRIPTELEIKILQHIADEDEGDRSRWLALVNSALVCKAWTGYVRSHLYYAINMNVSRGSRQLECLHNYTHLRPFLREFTWPETGAGSTIISMRAMQILSRMSFPRLRNSDFAASIISLSWYL